MVIGNSDVELSYSQFNTSKPQTIVFLHGVFGQGEDWINEGYHHYLENFHLIFVDLRGHGSSPKPKSNFQFYNPELNAKDIVALMDILNIKKAIFWGYSYGGRMAYAMGVYFPDRVELIITGGMHPFPVQNVIEGIKFRQSIIAQGMKKWVAYLERNDISISDYTRSTLLRNDNKALNLVDDSIMNWKGFPDLSNLESIDIILYFGERDKTYLELGRTFNSNNKRSKLIILDGLNHFTAFSDSETVCKIINSLIAD